MPTFSPLTEPSDDELRQVADLYRQAGWWDDAPQHLDLLRRLVAGSHCFWVARSAGRIVAMGRAISDRVSDAYIQDVTVSCATSEPMIGTRRISPSQARLPVGEANQFRTRKAATTTATAANRP